ncbi:hypothetical protein DN752_07525 [Echinicola strongylocentroti]|uniref:Uncharacterized protein n=2 Tax=Echinicola strongylocentroti TaxID=1795355 RepID=A0A2Z4IHF4_9BACT|nr:hypothetical protein DN752_07525 [Echinicola strongylocentroti]
MGFLAGSLMACSDADTEPDNPEGTEEEEMPEEAKCFIDKESWAMGVDHEEMVKYFELKSYDPEDAPGTEVRWLYLELEHEGEDHVHIGAVKIKELLEEEKPEGAANGEFVKLMIRIDEPTWYFGPETENVKVQGYNSEPTGETDPSMFDTHTGVAEVASGDDWEYYEVILKRYAFYSVYVGAKMEVACEE